MSVRFYNLKKDRIRSLPLKLQAKILNKLNVKQLLNATLVSKRWNTMITDSEVFKNSVWIRCYSPIGDLDSIRNSTRHYENFKLSDTMGGPIEAIVLHYLKQVIWKRVYLYIRNPDCPYLSELIDVIAETVEELELRSLVQLQIREDCTFPKLKRLRIVNCQEFVFEAFLFKTPILQTFSFDSPSQEQIQILPMLREKPHITHLHLKGRILNEIFEQNITRIVSLNLLTLSINNDSRNILSEDQENNVVSFIQNQKYLESLYLTNNICNNLINMLWNSMPSALTHISFKELSQPTLEDFFLIPNENIIELHFHGPVRTLEEIIPFLEACPNLERLYVQNLTAELVHYCGMYLLKLILIKYQHASEFPLKKIDRLETFMRLKTHPQIINKKFELFEINFTQHIMSITEYGWYRVPVYQHFLRFY